MFKMEKSTEAESRFTVAVAGRLEGTGRWLRSSSCDLERMVVWW